MAATNWAQQAEVIAHHYGKGKETILADGSWHTLCPIHGDSGTPNLHVTPTEKSILLHCHACGDTNKPELIKAVSSEFKISDKTANRQRTLKKDQRGTWINPVLSSAPSIPRECYLNKVHGARAPDLLWAYLNKNKEVILYNARFNVQEPDGKTSKIYRRLALYTPIGEPENMVWSWYGPDTELPLYGLEQLIDDWWTRPILLVEGEKAADAARLHFPDMVVIAFPGGANNYNRINWEPLLGDKLVTQATLWPDNDKAGQAMAHGAQSLSTFLLKRGVKVKVVPVFEQKALPNKWDLADPLPEHWGEEQLQSLLDKAEYAEVGETARVSQYCATLKSLDLSTQEFLNRSKLSCETHASSAESQCKRCPQYQRLDCPDDINYVSDMQLDWLFVTRHKTFFNVRTKEELDTQGFNALWASSPNHTLTGPTAAASTMLNSPMTSKVYDHTYRPNGTLIVTDESGQKRLNAWQGFALTPVYDTPPAPWLELAEYLVTDLTLREHILDWMAFLIQRPEQKVNHGLLLISSTQGVGKDSFVEPLREIFGNGNSRDITSRNLDSSFNEYLLQTKLLVISELDTIGHRNSTYDYMKPLLAAPPTKLNINVKGMKQIEIDNLVQVIAFSNKDVPVAIEDTDRRLLIYDIPHTQDQRWSSDKFQNYYAWLRNGGAREVFGWLAQRDISAFDASAPAPHTEAKTRMAEGADQRTAFILDMIRNFAPPFHRDLLSSADMMEFLREEYGSRVRFPSLERALVRHDSGKLNRRLRIGNDRVTLFACRHYKFWAKQSDETLKRAYQGNWSDMRPIGADETKAPPVPGPKTEEFPDL